MKDFLKFTLATITGMIILSVIGIILFFMIIGALISSTEKQVIVENQSLLVLNLDRTIVDRAPNDPFEDLNIPGFQMERRIGLDKITEAIKKAETDNRIKGIYLDLSVVNGGMASVEEIRNALLTFKKESDKPVYAYSSMYDQKAYYLASVADKIMVHPLGSIDFRGLGGEMTFYKNALEKLGVEAQIIRHGKFKAAVEPFMLDKMSDENREQTLVYMNSLWNHMLQGISQERKIPVEKLNSMADEVLTFKKGNQLVETGLVDGAKYKDEVLDDLRQITGITGKRAIPIIGINEYSRVAITGEKAGFSKNKIAVIYASGDIGVSIAGEGIDGETLAREIRKVRQDSSYKAIVLRINSPGGGAFESDVIWREVKLAADEKVVVASFGDVAASGGYYIGCAADKIVASPNTITGSIGVFGIIPNAEELLKDKLGITHDVVKTNKNSNLISLTRPMTEYEKLLLQQNIEDVYDTFISHVADGRKMEKTKVDEIGQGRVWSGENAKENGLIDQYGGLKESIELAAEIAGLEGYRTVDLPSLPDPIQELFSTGTDNIKAWWLKNELGENYKYYEKIKEVASMKGILARMPFDLDIQ
jgi:protease-4